MLHLIHLVKWRASHGARAGNSNSDVTPRRCYLRYQIVLCELEKMEGRPLVFA